MDARLSYLRVFEDMLTESLSIEDWISYARAGRFGIAILRGLCLCGGLMSANELVRGCARHSGGKEMEGRTKEAKRLGFGFGNLGRGRRGPSGSGSLRQNSQSQSTDRDAARTGERVVLPYTTTSKMYTETEHISNFRTWFHSNGGSIHPAVRFRQGKVTQVRSHRHTTSQR